MKKKYQPIAIILVFLVISVGYYVFTQYVPELFRYQTAKESFEKSASSNELELVEIIECQSIAFIIYKNPDNSFSNCVIAKDSRGWMSMHANQGIRKDVAIDDGFLYFHEVKGKYISRIVMIVDASMDIPTISDNAESDFLIRYYELKNGRKIIYAFAVLDENFPNDYRILIGNEEITRY